MKRSFWALPVCAIAVGALVLSAGAQRSGKGGGGGTPSSPVGPVDGPVGAPVDGPFTIGKRTYPSKAAWIASGGFCGTPIPSDATALAVEQAIAAYKGGGTPKGGRSNGGFRVRAASAPRTVNVWFHVITDTRGNGDISDSDLQATIDWMNEAYAGLQPPNPFKPSAQETGDVPFRFRIAGIERVANDVWHVAGDDMAMKSALRIGGAADLNVYAVDLGNTGLLGYAWFPFWYVGGEIEDGIVVDTGTFTNGNYSGYSSGDVMVHEAGHWVGLFHTFQGSCFRPGDSVGDTPAEAYPYFASPWWGGFPDTCTILIKQAPWTTSPGRDPIENFMDYSAEDTKFQFTPGQATRADKLMKIFRGV